MSVLKWEKFKQHSGHKSNSIEYEWKLNDSQLGLQWRTGFSSPSIEILSSQFNLELHP